MTLVSDKIRLTLHPPLVALIGSAVALSGPIAHADNGNTVVPNNARLNAAIFADIYAAQQQNGCTTDTKRDGRLLAAAQRHTRDVLTNPNINGDVGSDGSTPQDRGRDAGFNGKVAETVATLPSLAINGIDILGQWWWDPPSRATMQDCANTNIGVWSENSFNRSVLVAVYGQPAAP
jgi:hypothetical protein